MDHPIIYTRSKTPPNYVSDKMSLNRRLYIALANDNKADLMTLMNDPGFVQVRNSFTLYSIFSYDAFEIAMAVFDGEIEMEDEPDDKSTFLHLATIYHAPRLTEYFLQNGSNVDGVCDIKKFNLQDVTPIGLSTCNIGEKETIFELLFYICFHNRRRMETIRMLVQREQNFWATEAFTNYAKNVELPELTALFLATPELFLKSPESGKLCLLSELNRDLSSLEHNVKQLLLLLDVFALVGHKLAAYIRLEEFAPKSYTTKEVEQSMLEIVSFLREAAELKHRGAAQEAQYVDYFLRFFEVCKQNSDDDGLFDWADYGDLQDWYKNFNQRTSRKKNDVLCFLPDLLQNPEFKRREIYRIIPTLEAHDKDTLTKAIANKLSSMSSLHEDSEDKRREPAVCK